MFKWLRTCIDTSEPIKDDDPKFDGIGLSVWKRRCKEFLDYITINRILRYYILTSSFLTIHHLIFTFKICVLINSENIFEDVIYGLFLASQYMDDYRIFRDELVHYVSKCPWPLTRKQIVSGKDIVWERAGFPSLGFKEELMGEIYKMFKDKLRPFIVLTSDKRARFDKYIAMIDKHIDNLYKLNLPLRKTVRGRRNTV